MEFVFQPMDAAAAREVLSWRYEEPYGIYNPNSSDLEEDIQVLIDPANGYFYALDEDGRVGAFVCFGLDAQVPGGEYDDDALDAGWGLRPDLTGGGLGPALIRACVKFGRERYGIPLSRCTIATFNSRSTRAAEAVGFVRTALFRRTGNGMEFAVLVLGAKECH